MVESLAPLMSSKTGKLTSDERTLIAVSFKNCLKPHLKVWRTLKAIEMYEKFDKYQKHVNEYKDRSRQNIYDECSKIIDIIQKSILESINR